MSLFSNSDDLIFSVKWWKMQHFTKQIVGEKYKAIERIFYLHSLQKWFAFFLLLLLKKKKQKTLKFEEGSFGFVWYFFILR